MPRIIGGAVVLTVVVMAVAGATPDLPKPGPQDSYGLRAIFSTADGIRSGDPVMVAGLPVGVVSGLTLSKDRRAVVTLDIRRDVRLPTDSAAQIVSAGLLGGKRLRIVPGGDSATLAPGESFEFSQSAVVMEDVLRALIVRGAAP